MMGDAKSLVVVEIHSGKNYGCSRGSKITNIDDTASLLLTQTTITDFIGYFS